MDKQKNIPTHLGVIVDGNGRWAQKRGLSRSEGHKAGAENLKKIIRYIFSKNIKILSVYVFSTENFKRGYEEVNYLMELFVKNFQSEFLKLKEENVKIVFSGRKDPLPNDVIDSMNSLVDGTKNNNGYILNICLNYGGHSEIIDATKKISRDIKNNLLSIEAITEEIFSKYLYNDLPPLDFLIRTSGELRLSNFMLWQASYAELHFSKVLFPDFDNESFDKALLDYSNRSRHYGGARE